MPNLCVYAVVSLLWRYSVRILDWLYISSFRAASYNRAYATIRASPVVSSAIRDSPGLGSPIRNCTLMPPVDGETKTGSVGCPMIFFTVSLCGISLIDSAD